MPEHCGVKKAEWYEEVVEEKIVSPLSSACEAAFRYTGSGEIRPALEENLGARAEATIDLLVGHFPNGQLIFDFIGIVTKELL